MASDEILWKIEEHTRAKHRILRGYLEAWLPIIGSQFPGMNLIDGFAGPGEYENGEPGSPIIMLDSLLDHASLQRITAETTFTFIEQDERRIAHLRSLVDARKDRIPPHVSVDIVPGRYEDHIETVLTRLGNDPQRPTFAFIDPFGYSSADMADNGRILRVADRCEVLMFVPLSHVARFVGRPGQDNAMTGLFGSEEWRDAIALDGDERKALLHDLFVKQLQHVGKLPYVRSFEIRTKATTGHHLFFGTRSKLGLSKMKDSMWKVDPTYGASYRDTTDRAVEVLFQEEPDFELLRDAWRNNFGTAWCSIEQVLEFTLVATPFREAHVKGVLKNMEVDGTLEADESTRSKKRTYPKGTRLRFKMT